MIADRVRVEAYTRALRAVVTTDSDVLEIGTATGYFALSARSLGAHHVYAIEPDDTVITARDIARVNHLDDRIDFMQADSRSVELKERADVVFSDLRGVLPPFQQHIPTIVDARKRLLKPGGTLIPQCDTLWVAPVSAAERYVPYDRPWGSSGTSFNTAPLRDLMVNTWAKADPPIAADELLTEPACWAHLDYTAIDSPDIAGMASWVVTRPGIAHGLALWFDTTLLEGISFSNAPGQPTAIYGQAFFPFSQPIKLATGDRLTVHLRADLIGDDYVWSWQTEAYTRDEPATRKVRLKQSTSLGTPLSLSSLRAFAPDATPAVSIEGQLLLETLARLDGRTPLAQIAHELTAKFPEKFASDSAALDHVRTLARQYAR